LDEETRTGEPRTDEPGTDETRQERPLRSKRRERRATGAGDGPSEFAAGLSGSRPTESPGQTVRLTDVGEDGSGGRDLREAHTAAGPLVADDEFEDTEEAEPPDGEEDDPGEEGEEEERYDSWPEWLADNWTTIALRLGVVAVIFVVVLFVGARLFGGGDDEGAGSAGEAGNAQREGSEDGSAADGPAPRDAGELRVQVGDDGAVSVSLSASEVRPAAAEWAGSLKKGDGTATVSLAPATDTAASQASFTSVLSEEGARSWLGMIKDTATFPGMTLEAVQASDPGAAALEGRTPFLRGSYVVKADDGSFSASGSFEDLLLDESTVERTYEETYLAGGEPKRRTISAEYRVSGDAGLLPAAAGYELPPEAGPPGTGG
jgi:hypothetical protein